MLAIWSQRVLTVALAAWLILGTTFFARPSAPLLPNPLSGILFITITSISLGALFTWFAAMTFERQEAHDAAHVAALEAQDARDGRIYYEMARVRGELARLRDAIEQTMDLGRRPPLAVVGSAAVVEPGRGGVDPDILDLSRKLHRKMIEGDPA